MAVNCTRIQKDTVDQYQATLNSKGWKVTRKWVIYGVTGTTPYDRLVNCVNADDGTTQVPALGAAIPGSVGILLQEKQPRAITGDTFELVMNYASYTISASVKNVDYVPFQPGITTRRISATLGQTETTKDKDDNEIKLSYTYPQNYIYNEKKQGVTETIVARVSKLIPQKTTTLTKKVTSITASDIDAEWEAYGGKVNSATWLGGNPRTWLYAGIEAIPNQDMSEWDVSCTFQYRPDAWDDTSVFIDANTGQAPEDVDDSVNQPNAMKTPKVLKEADFSGIMLA